MEHEEDIIANADYLVDIGPHAGVHGGKVVFAGPYEDIHSEAADCLTAKYMSGRMEYSYSDTSPYVYTIYYYKRRKTT